MDSIRGSWWRQRDWPTAATTWVVLLSSCLISLTTVADNASWSCAGTPRRSPNRRIHVLKSRGSIPPHSSQFPSPSTTSHLFPFSLSFHKSLPFYLLPLRPVLLFPRFYPFPSIQLLHGLVSDKFLTFTHNNINGRYVSAREVP